MMKIEIIEYKGWKECIQLSNGKIRLVITTQVGPRIIFFGFIDGENLFYENPDQVGTTGGEGWKIYGGHRLWYAPEETETTYVADNFPVQYEYDENKLVITAPVESAGTQKTIEIFMNDHANRVSLFHKIVNRGKTSITLAPWPISVMKTGGVAVIPLNLGLPDQFQPTHNLALWNYSNLTDRRIIWGDQFILLRQDTAIAKPLKIGSYNRYGWAGYSVNNELFVKRFSWVAGAQYPDFNCNFECYTNDKILELESLAPLVRLEPGEMANHEEIWEIYAGIPTPVSEADVIQHIFPLVK